MKTKKNMLNIEDTYTSREDASVLSFYMKELNKIPLLTREEEVVLAKKAKEGNKRARDKMIESNLRFVVKIAKTIKTKDYHYPI